MQCSDARWLEGLPRLYVTQKAKCWATSQHVCSRAGHCCMRRIASWAAFPCRPMLRRIGRAWRLALSWLAHGAATQSMATSAKDLRSRCADLSAIGGAACQRCGRAKDDTAAVVLDASAMYEKVPPSQVLAAARCVADVLRREGYQGMLVRQERRLRGRPTRASGSSRCGWTFCALVDMLRVLRASLTVTLARYGDEVFRQAGGLPIGGPLSDLGAGLLLGLQEAAWRRIAPLRLQAEWPQLPTAMSCTACLAQVRYVDDIITVSRAFCPECLASLVVDQHPGVPFTLEESSAQGAARWLDLLVYAKRSPVQLAPALPELPWILQEADVPKTFRLPPFLGERHMDVPGVRSHIRSRLSRWGQMQLSRRELVRVVVYEYLLFVRSGFPPRLVTTLWTSHSRDHREAAVVRRAVQAVARWWPDS